MPVLCIPADGQHGPSAGFFYACKKIERSPNLIVVINRKKVRFYSPAQNQSKQKGGKHIHPEY